MTAETATVPVTPETFNASAYLLRAADRPDAASRTAITGPGGDVAYAELAGLTAEVAAGLEGWGVRAEERVILFMADGPAMVAVILGAMRLGAVPVPVSTMLTGAELAGLVNDARARIIVVSDRFAAPAQEALALTPGVRRVVVD
ncbi:MAG TPA: AMP-binding protein, partial [Spirillospora sp.]